METTGTQEGIKAYRGDGWEIRVGRWQESPPEGVDVVISDPPYDERTHKGGRRGKGFKKGGGSKAISEARPIGFDPIDPADIAPGLLELSSRWVVLFCAIEQLGDYARAAGEQYIRGGIYRKTNPTPQFSGDRPGQPCDGIAILHPKGKKRWNGGGKSAQWSARAVGRNYGEDRHHETQKPIKLMIDLVRLFSDPGELVWDPYAGSGTTGIAALRLGRRFIGHELQPHYAEIAAERLAAEERGLTLFAARMGQLSIMDQIKLANTPTAAEILERLKG